MKKLLSIILLIPLLNYGQVNNDQAQTIYGHTKESYIVFGVGTGFNFNVNRPTIQATLGYRYKDFFVSSNMILTTTFNALAPAVFPFDFGYDIGSFQPFISYNYETIGYESKIKFRGTPYEFNNCWRPGFGLSYYFKSIPLSITAQRQGRINILSLGCYKSF